MHAVKFSLRLSYLKINLILFMKKLFFSILFVMQSLFLFSQTGTGVSGRVIDSKTNKPLQNVVASIQNTNLTELTDVLGKFSFKDVPVGTQ